MGLGIWTHLGFRSLQFFGDSVEMLNLTLAVSHDECVVIFG